ncbi:MAG: hypothetical protein R3F17_04475 [Planctomycetota bacterium]
MNQTLSNKERGTLMHLAAWLREESHWQQGRIAALQKLRETMAKADPSDLEGLLQGLEEPPGRQARESRRRALFQSLAEAWGMSPSNMNLRVIAQRAGESGAAIAELREELAQGALELAREARRVNATARMHRTVILDVLNAIFDMDRGSPLEEQGRLLDAEA